MASKPAFQAVKYGFESHAPDQLNRTGSGLYFNNKWWWQDLTGNWYPVTDSLEHPGYKPWELDQYGK